MGIFGKKDVPGKFNQGDIGFTRKDLEKVFILKKLDLDPEDRNADLGPSYLVRGDKQFAFRLYECEILTLEEFMTKGEVKNDRQS